MPGVRHDRRRRLGVRRPDRGEWAHVDRARSHKERSGSRKGEGLDRGIPIEMPKGSVVYFTHGVCHWQSDRSEPGEMFGEDDWFEKMTAGGRDYVRASYVRKLHAFTEERKRELLAR